MLSYRFTLHTIGKSREYLCNLFHNFIASEHYNCVLNLTTMIKILLTLVYEQVQSLIHVYRAGGVRKSPYSEIELIPILSEALRMNMIFSLWRTIIANM